MKHYTIPVFIPELACPNRCVFCNQHSISGCHNQPTPGEVKQIIATRLSSMPLTEKHIEVGFFGGSFTGIDPQLQHDYLSIAEAFLKQKVIQGIRVSTRPDYINESALELLKSYGVTTIELGAQSMHDDVLLLSGRGHTVKDVENAARLIHKYDFILGLQMMTGLPGDSEEKAILTAKRIIELGAACTRIYPTLVIKGTELEQRFQAGLYHPQTLEDAVALTAKLLTLFNEAGVKVIRIGLHPSEDLVKGDDLLAGPFHVSFRQLVETEIWRQKLTKLIDKRTNEDEITIDIAAEEINHAIGYNGSNRKLLLNFFKKVEFNILPRPNSLKPVIVADKRIPLQAKNALRNIGNLVELAAQFSVYKTISGHPDIFMCQLSNELIIAPGIEEHVREAIKSKGYRVITGSKEPQALYPESARYNAVVTGELLIHNLKITDPSILERCDHLKHVNVKQGYTRCNLLPLNENAYITSDRGIEKALLALNKDVLYVDPLAIVLKGQKHGFFPGCCGIYNNMLYITGSLEHHHQGGAIRSFATSYGINITELFTGRLTDIGGIFFF